MRDRLGPGTTLGYCTNVHAGVSLDAMLSNLDRHATAVKAKVSPDAPMGVGLWFSHEAAAEADPEKLRDWLGERGLLPYTINGFPFGDFHSDVVKHDVYQPDWSQTARLNYTLHLARLLSVMLPEGAEGSISTLPVGWPQPPCPPIDLARAAAQMRVLADELGRIEAQTGRCIHVDLEPEPGCYLDSADDVVKWFEAYLLPDANETVVRRHIRVCHDICHSAVMFENQLQAIATYAQAGIRIGKAQVSSAIAVTEPTKQALHQLRQFREPRYLHQTVVYSAQEEAANFYVDLPVALEKHRGRPGEQWRVHFHVPLFLERIDALETTQDDVLRALGALRRSGVKHFEVETYAWDVLPASLATDDLAGGIAKELQWLLDHGSVPGSN